MVQAGWFQFAKKFIILTVTLLLLCTSRIHAEAASAGKLSLLSSRGLSVINQDQNITAQLSDADPLSGNLVNFKITSGPCANQSFQATTDDDGVATINYVCGLVGSDTIVASLEVDPSVEAQYTQRWTDHLPKYVAFGDSITTGESIPSCVESRQQSPWGCLPNYAVNAYPNIVANQLGYNLSNTPANYRGTTNGFPLTQLDRVGIWGYTLQGAIADQTRANDAQGPWLSQLSAIEGAQNLVTGALGINDLHFSDIKFWLKQYLTSVGQDNVTLSAQQIIAAHSSDFDQLFNTLKQAKRNGAHVITTLYYNPYDTANPACAPLQTIAERVVNTLDDELTNRSHYNGLAVADFRGPFIGHGAGSDQSYVYGSQCSIQSGLADLLPSWITGKSIQDTIGADFDPHPNGAGTQVMAQVIINQMGAD